VSSKERHPLDLLKDHLAAIMGGSGRLVLISGGLSSGKTHLLYEFSRYASGSGALLLWATGSRSEQMLQAGVIEQLFHNAALSAPITRRVSRLVTMDVLASPEVMPGKQAVQSVDFRAVREISSILLDLCDQQPLVICVDDIHFADALSLQILLYLQHRMLSRQMMMVLTEWERPQPTMPLFRAEMTRLHHYRIRLAPLWENAIAEIISHSVEPEVAARLSPKFLELSGGNPLLVKALLEDYCAAGPDAQCNGNEQPVIGRAFSEAVLACLHRWEPRISEVACGLVILADHTSLALIGRLVGISQELAAQAIEILTAAGLLRFGRFRHSAAEAAVMGSLPSEQRSTMHLHAAELLYHEGAPVTDIADHLIAAGRAADGWPIGVLRGAAEQALWHDGTDAAVRYLKLALAVCEDEQERVTIMSTLVHAAWRVNPSAALPYRDELGKAMRQSWLTERDIVMLIKLALWEGDVDAVSVALNALRDSSAGKVPAELGLALHLFYGSACTRLWDLGDTYLASGDQVPAADDPWTSATSALARVWAQGGDKVSTFAAEHIMQSCRLGETSLEAVVSALLILVYGDKPDQAAGWCDAMLDQASRCGATTWQAVLGAARAEVSLRRGDLASAAEQADTALSLLPPQGWGVLIGYPLSTMLLANTAMGRLEAAADTFIRAVPDAMFETVIGMRYLHARGQYYMAAGRLLAAVDDFQTCENLMRNWSLDVRALVPSGSSLAEATSRLGLEDFGTAAVPATALQPTRETSQTGLVPTQSPSVLDAESTWAPVRNGTQVADRLPLSDAECRVAELAVCGHTNREIGQMLWITISTVEQHLTHVYRKLGVRGRDDLAAKLALYGVTWGQRTT
jgi:DNA-binding CsgD family transcriptional regulator